jgi:hypothetical protein
MAITLLCNELRDKTASDHGSRLNELPQIQDHSRADFLSLLLACCFNANPESRHLVGILVAIAHCWLNEARNRDMTVRFLTASGRPPSALEQSERGLFHD